MRETDIAGWRRLVVILTFAVVLTAAPALGRGVVCGEHHIKGFELQGVEAKNYLPSDVHDVRQATFFITAKGKSIYVHTNFRRSNAPFAWKLATDTRTSLENIVRNIAGSPLDVSEVLQAASFVIHENLLQSLFWSRIDLSAVRSLQVIKGGRVHPARSFRVEGENPRWALQYTPGVFVDAAARDGTQVIDALRTQTFTKDDARLISFSLNSATVDRVQQIPNAITFTGSSTDALRAELQKHTGKTLFALGHVEEGAFVTRKADGTETFRIAMDKFEALAKDCCEIRLFAVGCHSAESVSRGMLGTFNTIRALDNYEKALEATTMLAFLEAMAGGDPRLALVVDSALVKDQVNAEVRVIAQRTPPEVDTPLRGEEVARIRYSSPPTPSQPVTETTDTAQTALPVATDATAPVYDTATPEDDDDDSSRDAWECGCVIAVLALFLALTVVVARRRIQARRRGN